MKGLFVGLVLGFILATFIAVKAQNFAYPVLPLSQIIQSWSNPVSIDSDSDGKINPEFIDEHWVDENGDAVRGDLVVFGQVETPKIILDCNTICQLSQAQGGGGVVLAVPLTKICSGTSSRSSRPSLNKTCSFTFDSYNFSPKRMRLKLTVSCNASPINLSGQATAKVRFSTNLNGEVLEYVAPPLSCSCSNYGGSCSCYAESNFPAPDEPMVIKVDSATVDLTGTGKGESWTSCTVSVSLTLYGYAYTMTG